ncbi:MAG: hypothetical protein ACRD4O_16795, partial [Bryobacteraceae bacterium]
RLLFITLCAFVVALALSFGWRHARLYGPVTGHAARGATVPAMVRSLRPDYPYSVIPGGAYSHAELRFADNHDPVVRKHYADFDVENVQLVTLASDRYEYASYRVKNRIYWTRKRLRLRKGEVLLTDGTHYARARCGNRLSNTRKGPTSDLQPPEAALNLPPFTPSRLYTLQLAEAPPPGALQQEYSPQPGDLMAAVLPKEAVPLQASAAWPALNQYSFPAVFTPGLLYQKPNQPTGPILPPPDGSTPPPGTPQLPPMLPIPEPATISLAAAILACLLLVSRTLFARRAERDRKP